MNPCFNLAREKGIMVLDEGGRVEEITLVDALVQAHRWRKLAGETPTQDVAMLRFLLAILYAALFGSRPFSTPDDALDAWFALWEVERFPADRIAAYLDRWQDRFWLFHEERPFDQVFAGRDGIDMENAADMAALEKPGKPSARGVQKASKLNGVILESGNTDKLFNISTGEDKNSLSYSQAARWLIHAMGYDDGGIKPYYPKNTPMNRNDDLARCSVAWLGSISPIYAEGDSLFETLMLNLVLLKDGQMSEEALWPRQRPTWEYDSAHTVEMVGTALPDNPAELCTFLSRRLMLIRRGESVLGYVRYVGEAFPREAAFTEQWTLWSVPKAKKGEAPLPLPRSTRMPAQMWREAGALLVSRSSDGFAPGVVRWVSLLTRVDQSPLRDRLCRFHYVKALYDVAQSSNMTEVLEDSLTFSVSLLTEAGSAWVDLVSQELDLYSRIAWQVGLLAEQLLSAEGGKQREKRNGREVSTPVALARREAAQEQFYHQLDQPFRSWLQKLRADDAPETRQAKVVQLRRCVRQTALQCGQEMLGRVSPSAFGKRMTGEDGGHATAPEAWVIFRRAVNKLIPLEQEGKNEGGV
ncbi:MAG: type I-E CRISPR-associated protein Cse1/CasA [Clostridia bacterium]|nr:type I-E CRISPR-associated protein Cse1/CasA [Clostridia bacterium]